MTWIVVTLGLLLSFVLSGIETAWLAVSRVRLRHHAKEAPRWSRAGALADLYFRDRDRFLNAVLIANGAASIAVFAAITRRLVDPAVFGTAGYGITFAVTLPVYLFLGEFLPKSISKRFPFRFLVSSWPVVAAVRWTVLPLVRIASRMLRWLRLADDRPGPRDGGGTERHAALLEDREEFKTLAGIIERDGNLGSDERRMIANIVDFHDVRASDVMIPIGRVTAVPVDMPVASLLALARETGLDQFPVLSRTGDLIGLVDVLEILRSRRSEREGRAFRFLRKLVRVSPDDLALDIVRRLRRTGIQLAGVYDPSGRPLGIASSEDLVARMIVRPSDGARPA